LVLPLALLTFFGAYVPVAGAVAAGLAATLVTLVTEGVLAAVAVSALVLVVQQVESNILQPVVVGRSVRLHPVAVTLSVTAGAVLGGIIGALIAVPSVAVAAAVLPVLRRGEGSPP
jgi:predicted PurR-regulated permease PerM